METTPRQLLKEFVNRQKFSSTTEVMSAMKELFGDVLQQVMECELDAELGYEKSQRESESAVETGAEPQIIGKSYPSCVKSREENWEILAGPAGVAV